MKEMFGSFEFYGTFLGEHKTLLEWLLSSWENALRPFLAKKNAYLDNTSRWLLLIIQVRLIKTSCYWFAFQT